MVDVIRCVEHQTIPIVEQRQEGQLALTHKQVELLVGIKTLPAGAFSWGHNSIKWSQYCGLVQLGGLLVEVLPKIVNNNSEEQSSRRALVQMLSKAGLFKIHNMGVAAIDIHQYSLLDVFIIDFCSQLNVQLLQGKLQEYVSKTENLPVIRGRFLASYQMRHNLAQKQRVYCQYDELSEDIVINQVFKYTLKLLLSRSRSDRAKNSVLQLLYLFDSVSDVIVTETMLASLVVDRLFARFENIIELCRLFVMSLAPGLRAGKLLSFALMFDMNRLFENWVVSMVKPIARRNALVCKEQGPQRFLAIRKDVERPVYRLKPDICLLGENSNPIIVIDAKWKLIKGSEVGLGVAQSDLYQMQAYANRYEVNHVVLMYPRQSSLEHSYQMRLQGVHNAILHVVTLDVTSRSIDNDFIIDELYAQ